MRKKFDWGTLTVGSDIRHLVRDDDIGEILAVPKHQKVAILDAEIVKGEPLEKV